MAENNIEYLDIWPYRNDEYPFQIFIGGRDGGKTYSYLRGLLDKNDEDGIPFIFMRRLKTELDELCDDKKTKQEIGNVFAELNRDTGRNVGMRYMTDKTAGIYNRELKEDGTFAYIGSPRGYATSLGSVAKIKGIDWQACDDWFYDEFIPEPHVPRMKAEGRALVSAYDTICRNRELKGKKAIKLTMCANSTDIYNDVCKYLGIVSDLEKMQRQGKQHRYYKDRGLAVHLMQTPESLKNARANTALGRLMKGTDYYDMAFNNKFAYNDFSLVGYKKLNGWKPIAHLDDAYIYIKKGERLFHVSYAPAVCEGFTAKQEQDERLFRRRVGIMLQDPYMESRITFESYELKAFILEHIF